MENSEHAEQGEEVAKVPENVKVEGRAYKEISPESPQYATGEERSPMDSNQAMNMGPPSNKRSQNMPGFGDVGILAGGVLDRVRETVHDVVEKAAAALGDPYDSAAILDSVLEEDIHRAAGPPPGLKPEDLPGMPGTMEEDQKWRELHPADGAEISQPPATKEFQGRPMEESEKEQDAEPEAEGKEEAQGKEQESTVPAKPEQPRDEGEETHAKSVLGVLSEKVAEKLQLQPKSLESEQQAQQGPSPAQQAETTEDREAQEEEVIRTPAAPGTPEVELPSEAKEGGRDQRRKDLGIPTGAGHTAETSEQQALTKEGGKAASTLNPAIAKPGEHVPDFAPEFAKPNFFEEVGKRGISNVVKHTAANIKDSAQRVATEAKHGGPPAPWAVDSGVATDTKDVTRNVERLNHLDDPQQRKIYDAEVEKVHALPGKVIEDKALSKDKEQEAHSAILLGKDKPISGAVPHDVPEHQVRGTPSFPSSKHQAGKGIENQGTGTWAG